MLGYLKLLDSLVSISFHVYLRSAGTRETGTGADTECDSGGLESAQWQWEGAHPAARSHVCNAAAL